MDEKNHPAAEEQPSQGRQSGQETPGSVVDEPRFLAFQEMFEVSQSLGRVLERLDHHAKKIDKTDESIQALTSQVTQLLREFGFIKKAWWIGIFLLGYFVEKIISFVGALPVAQG